MKPLFARNLSNTGRLVRGLGALALFVGAGFGFRESCGWRGAGGLRAVRLVRSPARVVLLRAAASRPESEGTFMNEFALHTELWLPRPRTEVFPFFAEARNLEAITPPWLQFEVLTPAPFEMQAGT